MGQLTLLRMNEPVTFRLVFKTKGHAPAASEVILINCKERSAAPVGFFGRYLTAEAMSLQSMGRTSLWKSIDQVRSTECIDQVRSEEFPKHYRSPQGALSVLA